MPLSPKEIWAADITYIRLLDKFLYFSVVLDIETRKVIGWSIDKSLELAEVIRALKMAFVRESTSAGIICHSDRGVQYASSAYRDLLEVKEAIPA